MTPERLEEIKDSNQARPTTSFYQAMAIKELWELITEVERLRAIVADLKYPCGNTFTENSLPCLCWACIRNARIDAALKESQ